VTYLDFSPKISCYRGTDRRDTDNAAKFNHFEASHTPEFG